MKIDKLVLFSLSIFATIAIDYWSMSFAAEKELSITKNNSLLSDPFLQLPTESTVNVVWFTEFAGDRHVVNYGTGLKDSAIASTTKLTRVREDRDSQIENPPGKSPRDIWRHEATVTNLSRDRRVPYRVISHQQKQVYRSNIFTLAPLPDRESALKILLTSDHQLMPMTPANLEQVVKTVGRVDAVFLPGDLVNIPDRASEWFDDLRGGAFFPSLQGKANYELERDGVTTTYHGGEIIQHAPLFTAIGNHEVMGKIIPDGSLKEEFGLPQPRELAKNDASASAAEIKNNSFNTDTYEEIFTLPQSESGGEKYYATTFGDIRLISLYVTNIWRSPSLEADIRGRYKESDLSLNDPEEWGYGQHIFEAIAPGSPQYQWLERELQSKDYQQAKYKIVMFHHPPHTLGGNIVPPYTNPQPKEYYSEDGELISRYYDYPIEADYIIRDLIPLLEEAGVQLVYYGHSHLWNRFRSASGMHFLESSNVGNSYGAHLGDNKREVPTYSPQNYVALGDPNGLEAIVPNVAPVIGDRDKALPYIASNEITAFSIFDTATGTVSSYRYDTRKPDTPAILFDRFTLRDN